MLELIAILLFIPHTMVLEINTAIYTFIFLLLVIFYRKLLSSKSQTGLPCLPPSPRGLPIVGHLHLLNNTPHQSFHNLCTRYGPLIHLRLGSVLRIIASTPELAKELLITNGLTFASRPMNIVINLLTYNSSGFSFAPYGPYWKFLIPAKTILFISNWSICRDPNNWKDPLEFQPERFMSASETDDNAGIVDVRGQHFNLLPFGSGRRGCPGVSLAVQVVPTVLALLIQCFHWKIAGYGDEMTGKLVDMTERPGLTVPKAQPLMLVPSTRLRPFPNYADCGLIRVARE